MSIIPVRHEDIVKSFGIKPKPILFNTEMVKIILDGRKTQTRRVIKSKADSCFRLGTPCIKVDLNETYPYGIRDKDGAWGDYKEEEFIKKFSNYQVGDILYVRETFTKWGINVLYKADGTTSKGFMDIVGIKWKPSIHMPKEYARIFLKVTGVRVERLQNISSSGYDKEGFDFSNYNTFTNIEDMKKWWISLWNSTAQKGFKWEDNPYVFVYEFERITK